MDGFNEQAYLSANPDVARAVAGIPGGALQHYRDYGMREGRSPAGQNPTIFADPQSGAVYQASGSGYKWVSPQDYQAFQQRFGPSWSPTVSPGFGVTAKSLGAIVPPPPPPPPTPEELIQRQKTDFQALLDKQRQEQEGFFGQYEQARGGQEALPALYERLRREQGLPELQQQMSGFKGEIYKVQALLDRLGEDVNSRTTGTFTSESQRRRIEAAEGGELRSQLGRLGTGLQPLVEQYTGKVGEVSNILGLTTQQQERELEPMKMRLAAVSDRFSREITGFSEGRQNELSVLLNKLENDRQLENREWERVQTLAAEEREWTRKKQELDQDEAYKRAVLAETIRSNQAGEATARKSAASGGGSLASLLGGASSRTSASTKAPASDLTPNFTTILSQQYSGNPKATRAQQDNWVRQWARNNGLNPDLPGDPFGIWATYDQLYPWSKYGGGASAGPSKNTAPPTSIRGGNTKGPSFGSFKSLR